MTLIENLCTEQREIVNKRQTYSHSGSWPVFTWAGRPVPGSRLQGWGDVQLGRYRLKDGLVLSYQTALDFCVAGTVSSNPKKRK